MTHLGHDVQKVPYFGISGVNLFHNGTCVCREWWPRESLKSDPRRQQVIQYLGQPVRAQMSGESELWFYEVPKLTIETSRRYPWKFFLGAQEPAKR